MFLSISFQMVLSGKPVHSLPKGSLELGSNDADGEFLGKVVFSIWLF